jgi:cyclophilin family peptidyl-prolyl cis-trans isomerase
MKLVRSLRAVFLCILLFGLAGCASMGGTPARPDDTARFPRVVMETTMGDVVLELNRVRAPKTTEMFLRFVEQGLYDGTVFHALIDNVMLQGGYFDENLKRRDTGVLEFTNEADNGLTHEFGTIAFSHRNAGGKNLTPGFFINVNWDGNPELNYDSHVDISYGLPVFGKIVGGMDTVLDIVEKAQDHGRLVRIFIIPDTYERIIHAYRDDSAESD